MAFAIIRLINCFPEFYDCPIAKWTMLFSTQGVNVRSGLHREADPRKLFGALADAPRTSWQSPGVRFLEIYSGSSEPARRSELLEVAHRPRVALASRELAQP